jgi:hypothetical protein
LSGYEIQPNKLGTYIKRGVGSSHQIYLDDFCSGMENGDSSAPNKLGGYIKRGVGSSHQIYLVDSFSGTT